MHGQFCCLCLFSFFLHFLPLSFSEVETASEMTKTMLEWNGCFTYISEYHISEPVAKTQEIDLMRIKHHSYLVCTDDTPLAQTSWTRPQ